MYVLSMHTQGIALVLVRKYSVPAPALGNLLRPVLMTFYESIGPITAAKMFL